MGVLKSAFRNLKLGFLTLKWNLVLDFLILKWNFLAFSALFPRFDFTLEGNQFQDCGKKRGNCGNYEESSTSEKE